MRIFSIFLTGCNLKTVQLRLWLLLTSYRKPGLAFVGNIAFDLEWPWEVKSMTFRHWTPSCQLQPATTLKVGNPSPSNWQHRYLKVSSLQKSKLQPWGICINYKTPHSLMIKWYCGGMVRRPLRNLPVCSTLHCAELGHSLQPVPRCSNTRLQ